MRKRILGQLAHRALADSVPDPWAPLIQADYSELELRMLGQLGFRSGRSLKYIGRFLTNPFTYGSLSNKD